MSEILSKENAALRARVAELERELENESGRWASRLSFVHREHDVDGSGTESGDPLDVIEAEVRGALLKMRERAEGAEAELARLRSVVGAAKAWRAKHTGNMGGSSWSLAKAVDALRADETRTEGPQ